MYDEASELYNYFVQTCYYKYYKLLDDRKKKKKRKKKSNITLKIFLDRDDYSMWSEDKEESFDQ